LIQDICNKIDKKFELNFSQYVFLLPVFWPLLKLLLILWPFGVGFYLIFTFFISLKTNLNDNNKLYLSVLLLAASIAHPIFSIFILIFISIYFKRSTIILVLCNLILILFNYNNEILSQFEAYFEIRTIIWFIFIIITINYIGQYFISNKELLLLLSTIASGIFFFVLHEEILARIIYVVLIIIFLNLLKSKSNFALLVLLILISILYLVLSHYRLFDYYVDSKSKTCWLEYTKRNKNVELMNEFRIFSTYNRYNPQVELLDIYRPNIQENVKQDFNSERQIYIEFNKKREANILNKIIWRNFTVEKKYNFPSTKGRVICSNQQFIFFEN
jgi:hypothetical protein